MWRNYFAAALRNLFRNRAFAAINIIGLAIGFTAAILIGLFVRDEFSYDRMHPHADRIYRLSMDIKGATTLSLGNADQRFGPAFELDFAEAESVTRMGNAGGFLKYRNNTVWWQYRRADPNFFGMFPPQVLAGDAQAALQRPGMLVISRRFARRLFGRLDVVGLPVDVELTGRRTMHVGAVIENLPSNTHFRYDVVSSTVGDAPEEMRNSLTYVRLRPGTDVEKLRAALPGFVKRHASNEIGGQPAWKMLDLKLTPLTELHFLPPAITDMNMPSDRRTVGALIAIALLTLSVAGSNFVSMMTARAARRAVEVGVRKAVGATRGQIIVQFLGECLFYAGLALVLAIVAVELILPGFNGFLQRQIVFDYISNPVLGAGIAAAWLIVALAASVYPAAILSMFRPVTVLKGTLSLPGGPGRVRNAMVILQFGVLVALIIATITIHRQTRFAIEERLRVPGDQLFVLQGPCVPGQFQQEAMRVRGVRSTACASHAAMGTDRGAAAFRLATGGTLNVNAGTVDTGFFGALGITPIAGRLFDDTHGEDNTLLPLGASRNPSVILNESGARALGYPNPADAVGKSHFWSRQGTQNGRFGFMDAQESQIVGVVPDFTIGSIRNVIEPTVYYVDPRSSYVLMVRLDGQALPETLRGIENAWKVAAQGRPMIDGAFLGQMLNERYADIQRQTKLFAGFSIIAIVVASLGLLGLAFFTAERRTREIGVRKCMGASRTDILRFISWQFARPVLIANLIAWPVAWYFMRRWLQGFAYHVDLGLAAFALASALALTIALVTVSGHAIVVARSRPAAALRYE